MKLAICPRCQSEFPEDVLESPEQLQDLQAEFDRHPKLGCELCQGKGVLDGRVVKFSADEVRRLVSGDEFDLAFYNEKYGV